MVAWWWVLLAFLAGGVGGIVVACMMAVAGQADEAIEKMEREFRQGI